MTGGGNGVGGISGEDRFCAAKSIPADQYSHDGQDQQRRIFDLHINAYYENTGAVAGYYQQPGAGT